MSDLHMACDRLLRAVRMSPTRAADLARFWSAAESIPLEPGAVLLREGDRGDALLLVVDGTVGVSIRGKDGSQMHVTSLPAPLLVGTTGAVDGESRMATCTMESSGTVLRLRRGVFLDLVRRATPEAEVVRELILLTMHEQLLGANERLRRLAEPATAS